MVALRLASIDANACNDQGDTALIMACRRGMKDVALRLSELPDIEVNAMNKKGDTALIWACCNKMNVVALRLLELSSIDVNARKIREAQL